VKHGALNATLPDRDRVDSLTLDDALALLEARAAKIGPAPATRPRTRTTPPRKRAPAGNVAEGVRAYVPVVKTGRTKLAAAGPAPTPKAKAKVRSRPVAKTTSRANAKPATRRTTTSKRK
jgi:DNA topoisomerase-1